MNRLLVCVATIVILLPAQRHLHSQESDDNSATIDELASKMPRVPAKTPTESAAAIKIANGFRVEVVAAEPFIHDPVAIDFDEHGRAFVVELPQYNAYAVEGFEGRGSIRMLEDSNGDGRYEKSTLFADDLDYPTAIACWDGGVFVGAAPDLLYLKDTDGDGKADERRVIFTGFGKDKAGEAHLNSFRWGFDNRFHISTNLAGGDVRVASDPKSEPMSVRGRGIIFDPRDLSRFELTSGGGQHGMSMDNWGRKFVCSNSVPAQTLMYDDRYIARNPHVKASAPAVDIAPDGKHTKLFRISPNEPWRVLRTSLRKNKLFRGSDEGGAPFGFFTGATGITIYRGNAFPAEYRGNLIVGDVANNLIYRADLEADGLKLIARRADDGREFLASTDIWFRPVQFANAPDGTLFALDIYRELIEGAAFLPPEFIKYLDPIGGNDRGRIYRIAPDGFEQPSPPRLGEATTAELVALVTHENGWHRDTASRLLYQRQDRAAVPPLRKVAASADLPAGRMTALYSLAGLAALTDAEVMAALDDPAPIVRAHALRLSEEFIDESPALTVKVTSMTDDDDLRVRYQLAFSLGASSGASRNGSLAQLALKDGADAWMRMAVHSSLADGAGEVFGLLAANDTFAAASHGRELLLTLARQIGTDNRADEVAIVLQVLGGLSKQQQAFGESLVQALVEQQQGAEREKLLAAAGGKANEILMDLLSDAKTTALDEVKPSEQRAAAVKSLRLASFEDVNELISGLLDLQQPTEVQEAALETLGGFDQPNVAATILHAWPTLSPRLRARAAETLVSRPGWIAALLDAVEAEFVRRGDLDPARIELLKRHPDEQLAQRVTKLFAGTGFAKRQEVVDRYQAALERSGDADRGKLVFKKVCSACHKLEDVGNAIGADLTAVRNRGLPTVLLNVLDPNREVKPKFLSYVVATDDGRVIAGLIEDESANSLTIRRVDGTQVNIQRSEIEELKSTGLSFMPEGLEKDVDVAAMADLLAYLDSIR